MQASNMQIRHVHISLSYEDKMREMGAQMWRRLAKLNTEMHVERHAPVLSPGQTNTDRRGLSQVSHMLPESLRRVLTLQ